MIDEMILRQLYLEEQRSIRSIADLQHLPTRTVYDALINYRIPRRPAGFHSSQADAAVVQLSEIMLRRWYIEEKRSIRTIALLADVSTRVVYNALIRYRIPRRTSGYRQPKPLVIALADTGTLDEATLRCLYQKQGQSIMAIAEECACSPSRIRNALVRWGIERRRRGRRYSAA